MQKLFLMITLVFLLTGTAFAAVNINTATQAELESLQGIGPAKAKAIVEYRERGGTFASVDDLAKVGGIGAGTIKQLRDSITVESEKSTEASAKPE